MCGITGIASQSKIEDIYRNINRMNDVIYHRGPDGSGVWVNDLENVGFGHRRLSIIDLSSKASQPMIDDTGDYLITYNGEIYNFKEIRTQLEIKGQRFRSNSDTEVILRAYIEWGESSFLLFNGMWAFGLFDMKKNIIYLVRDRIGIKPLYYTMNNKRLIFSSEIKSIISSGLYKSTIDLDGLSEYLTFQNIISDNTFFNDVKLLSAGNILKYDISKGTIEKKEYWDFDYIVKDKSIDYYRDLILENFNKSIDRHLISDVEIGATISGGMDSSALVAIMSKRIRELKTFTGYFNTLNNHKDDKCVSEKSDARIISNEFNTDHHEKEIVYQDVIDTLPAITWHLEDPKVGMCYTFYNISQLVSQKVKVNISGTGGDEAFAGYPWRYSVFNKNDSHDVFSNKYFKWWTRLYGQNELISLLRPEILKMIDTERPFKEFNRIITKVKNLSNLNKALYFENKTFLQGMLMVEDRMGMAYSLETRFPFLDNDMIDLSQSIPDEFKVKDGIPKYMLKSAFSDLLPKSIINKRKQGFTPPDKTWYSRELKGYIEDSLLGYRSRIQDLIDKKTIRNTLISHEEGKDERLKIWSLLSLESWLRTFDTDRSDIHITSM